MEPSLLDPLIGQDVVIDVVAPYVYIGRFTAYDVKFLVLEKADAHDLRDSTTTRENYVVETRRHGINQDRKRLLLTRSEIVAIARLEDVML